MLRRALYTVTAAAAVVAMGAGPALACGGLIGPRGSVQLLRTTTLAGYHDGIEHYVTSFRFAGAGAAFGSIIPLPGIPDDVVEGGRWTLQRLDRETQPLLDFAEGAAVASAAPRAAAVIAEYQVKSLDLTVLQGGGDEVGIWAKEQGFRLPPDAPEVLDFYSRRSQIFMAVRFDPSRAAEAGVQLGDGLPVHITIPTDNPWVPLRILGLGKQATELVEADVYLLTDTRPALLPLPSGRNGLSLVHDRAASDSLLGDLRSDKGMDWVPERAWLTKIAIDGPAARITHDLAVDASGRGRPSLRAAGLDLSAAGGTTNGVTRVLLIAAVGVATLGLVLVVGPLSRRLPSAS